MRKIFLLIRLQKTVFKTISYVYTYYSIIKHLNADIYWKPLSTFRNKYRSHFFAVKEARSGHFWDLSPQGTVLFKKLAFICSLIIPSCIELVLSIWHNAHALTIKICAEWMNQLFQATVVCNSKGYSGILHGS